MKNNKLFKGLIIAAVMMFSTSCGEDFLVETPLSFLSPENTFVDAAGLETSLQASLGGVFNQWNGDTRELMFNSNMSDATVIGSTDKPDAWVDLRGFATPINDRNNDAGRALSFYRENYEHIKNANAVIDNIDIPEWDGGENDPERNHLLGTAYFLRAFFYMQLTMQFGNVPFILNVVSEARRDFKVFHMQGIWDQMIEDLEFAEQWVKPKSEIAVGLPPKDAVRILLAKYYMLNERFLDAENLMTDAINDGESMLFTDAMIPGGVDSVRVANNVNPVTGTVLPGRSANASADAQNFLHMEEGDQKVNNPEGIWMLVNSPFILGTRGRSARIRAWGPNTVQPSVGVWVPGTRTVGMDLRQSTRDGESPMMKKWGRGQGFTRPTNYSQYDMWNFKGTFDEQDYRHKDLNWMEMEDVLYDNPGLATSAPQWYLQPLTLYDPLSGDITCGDTIRTWYGYPRYKFYAENREQQLNRQDGGKMNMYVMRFAEVYLVRAEARFWQDKFQEAADDLNVIRMRSNAIAMYTGADVQTDGIGAILDERNRELYGEEYRHDELVRMSVIFAKTGKQDYLGNTYSISGDNIEVSLSSNNFFYNRVMDKNTFYRDEVEWTTFTNRYTMDPKHIFWPIFLDYVVGNVEATLNQTTGYDGSENNIEPLTHQVQAAGVPNNDPMRAIGE